jgi:exopolysaccharide biosynthesis WecB/TagA/CpsF family protein
LPVYLYGSRPEVLEALSRNFCTRFPGLKIAGMQPSRFRQLSVDEAHEVAGTILQSGARIVLVGLGCPRQEVWVYEYRDALPMPLLAVGAAFDFHAGTSPQAPAFFQRAGLEWLFRLLKEPRRLWRRYVLFNPYYMLLVLMQAMRISGFDPKATVEPTEAMRYG